MNHVVDPGSTIRTCMRRDHLSRTGAVTIVVGTWLTLFNQGDVLLSGVGRRHPIIVTDGCRSDLN